MQIVEIINKKRIGLELSKEEIIFVVNNYVKGSIKDYQMSSFLMAIAINGMNINEVAYLTSAMINSGEVINFNEFNNEVILDKHSTGGVGDKVSLILSPILAALGAKVAKMSGRGLGHTGGTLDKLESIENFKIDLEIKKFKEIISMNNFSIISQSGNLVPVDKMIYALRDVTGTVESIPLIASSIMSKKLATGSKAILLDIKCGTGAFMKNLKQAKELGLIMQAIGTKLNKDIKIEITNMNEPLGKMVGNKNEIVEVINFLSNKDQDPLLKDLIFSSASTMLIQSKLFSTKEESKKSIEKVLKNKKALECFYNFIKLQGGNLNYLKNEEFWNPKHKLEIKANKKGFLNIFNAFVFGNVAAKLGAGRFTKDDKIDYEAGIKLNKKTNDSVQKGETLFILYSSNKINFNLTKELEKGFEIVDKPHDNKIILDSF